MNVTDGKVGKTSSAPISARCLIWAEISFVDKKKLAETCACLSRVARGVQSHCYYNMKY